LHVGRLNPILKIIKNRLNACVLTERGNNMKRLFMILSIPALLCSPAIAGELKKFSLDDAATLGFQKGQRPDKVTLNLVINGKGTVWIDDVVLSKAPLK